MSRGKSRDRLLEVGLELFGTKGYAATGVQDIADAAEVPKGSFYNYFDSKEDFAVAVLERYREQAATHFAQLTSPENTSPLGRLEAFLREMETQMVASSFGGGCLAGRLAQELAGEQVAFREPLCHVFSSMQGAVEQCLRQAQAAGELAADEAPALLAGFLVNTWQGAMLRAKAAGSTAPLAAARQILFSRLLVVPQSGSSAAT